MKRLALLVLLALPGTAQAAPLGQLPFTSTPAPAACLVPTGAPGGLSMLGPNSRNRVATDLLIATDAGARRSDRVELGRLNSCAAVAAAPGGAAVVAGTALGAGQELELRAAVRDPGGAFGAPAALSGRGTGPAVAVNAAGQAVVAWTERVAARRVAIVAARRAPGGAFGAPETLLAWRTQRNDFPEVRLAAGIDGGGTATVLWARELPPDDYDEHVEVATAAPGAAFAVRRLGSGVSVVATPVLSVAPDGWTLAAFDEGGADLSRAFERAPGGDFASLILPPPPDLRGTVNRFSTDVAVGRGGAAVIAWTFSRSDDSRGVEAITRASAGAFGPVRTVARPPRPAYFSSSDLEFDFLDVFNRFGPPPYDDDRRRLRTALGPDGRVAIAWTAPTGRPPLRAETAYAATGRLDGTFDAAESLGPSLRDTRDVAPLFLPDGRAAVGWTDNASHLRDGRLHLTVEGVPAPARPDAPRLTLRARRSQRLYASQSPRVIAGCDRPCDLRATVVGPRGNRGARLSSTRRRAGGKRLNVGSISGLSRSRLKRVRVVIHATVPGGGRTVARSVRLRVIRRPALPLRRPVQMTARRAGDEIVVRWRTRAPARRQSFIVVADAGRDDAVVAAAQVPGRGRTRFTARLRPPAGARVALVAVVAVSDDRAGERTAVVRLR